MRFQEPRLIWTDVSFDKPEYRAEWHGYSLRIVTPWVHTWVISEPVRLEITAPAQDSRRQWTIPCPSVEYAMELAKHPEHWLSLGMPD